MGGSFHCYVSSPEGTHFPMGCPVFRGVDTSVVQLGRRRLRLHCSRLSAEHTQLEERPAKRPGSGKSFNQWEQIEMEILK